MLYCVCSRCPFVKQNHLYVIICNTSFIMSVIIVTPWYINKVKKKTVLFHCYLLFKVNKWCIFNCFAIFNAFGFTMFSHSSLENATGRPTAGWSFSPFISACISFLFLFVGHLSCEACKGHHRAMVAALSYTFCTEHMRLNCSFPVLNQSAYIVVRWTRVTNEQLPAGH